MLSVCCGAVDCYCVLCQRAVCCLYAAEQLTVTVYCVNVLCAVCMLQVLKARGEWMYTDAMHTKQVAGFVKTFDKLTYVTVRVGEVGWGVGGVCVCLGVRWGGG